VKLLETGELLMLECRARRLSPNTLVYYEARLRAMVVTIGDKAATSVTTLDLRRVIVESPERSAPNNYHFMRRLFRFMLVEGVIRTNPMEKVRPPKIEQKITQAHTQDEIQTLYKTAKNLRDMQGFETL
jgi:site-specific recombinase XerD